MKRAIFSAATLIVLAGALARGQAPAVRIAFDEGRVTLTATDALVSDVLAEWARVGGTEITGTDQLPATRITVDFAAVSELAVLDELLGSAGGYVSGLRSEVPPGSSVLRAVQIGIGRRPAKSRPSSSARVIDMSIPESRFDYGAATDAPDPWDSIDEKPPVSTEPYVMPEMRYQYFAPDAEPQPEPEAEPEPESKPDPKTSPKTKKPPSGL